MTQAFTAYELSNKFTVPLSKEYPSYLTSWTTSITLKDGDTHLTLKELAPVRLVKNKFYQQVQELYKQNPSVDQLKDQIFPMIMDALTQEADQNNHAPFDGLDESLKATTIDQVFYLLKEAMKQSMGLPNDKDKEGEVILFYNLTQTLHYVSRHDQGRINEHQSNRIFY